MVGVEVAALDFVAELVAVDEAAAEGEEAGEHDGALAFGESAEVDGGGLVFVGAADGGVL